MRNNYWIDPIGKVYELGPGIAIHNDWAYEWLIDNKILSKNEIALMHMYPYEYMHKLGWVRAIFDSSLKPKVQIMGNCIDWHSFMRNTMDPVMNEMQISACKEICHKHSVDYYDALNYYI